ncbi:hypothetical protein G7Y89_g8988 [Cudoniella acicularis]|uniref:Uncharacterized protein n=1 Tax=Cudoniella acicularis TaxID=354080 RepID=A0A8H4RHQ4_9HELO|nr:hypothetical protein G7Y89_g8988 [Cudoniella acicularis]
MDTKNLAEDGDALDRGENEHTVEDYWYEDDTAFLDAFSGRRISPITPFSPGPSGIQYTQNPTENSHETREEVIIEQTGTKNEAPEPQVEAPVRDATKTLSTEGLHAASPVPAVKKYLSKIQVSVGWISSIYSSTKRQSDPNAKTFHPRSPFEGPQSTVNSQDLELQRQYALSIQGGILSSSLGLSQLELGELAAQQLQNEFQAEDIEFNAQEKLAKELTKGEEEYTAIVHADILAAQQAQNDWEVDIRQQEAEARRVAEEMHRAARKEAARIAKQEEIERIERQRLQAEEAKRQRRDIEVRIPSKL